MMTLRLTIVTVWLLHCAWISCSLRLGRYVVETPDHGKQKNTDTDLVPAVGEVLQKTQAPIGGNAQIKNSLVVSSTSVTASVRHTPTVKPDASMNVLSQNDLDPLQSESAGHTQTPSPTPTKSTAQQQQQNNSENGFAAAKDAGQSVPVVSQSVVPTPSGKESGDNSPPGKSTIPKVLNSGVPTVASNQLQTKDALGVKAKSSATKELESAAAKETDGDVPKDDGSKGTPDQSKLVTPKPQMTNTAEGQTNWENGHGGAGEKEKSQGKQNEEAEKQIEGSVGNFETLKQGVKNAEISQDGNAETGAKPEVKPQGGEPVKTGNEEEQPQIPQPLPSDKNGGQTFPESKNSEAVEKNSEPVEKNSEPVEKKSQPVESSDLEGDISVDFPGKDSNAAVLNLEPQGRESHFLAYLITGVVVVAVVYVAFHNKQKILGLIVEGRVGRGARRPALSGYSRLKTEDEDGRHAIY